MQVLGVLLFLFIPLTLFLFLRHPLGIPISYTIGISFMFTHRFVARPFMDSHLGSRCLWCARRIERGEPIDVETRRGPVRFVVCNARCRSNVRRFVAFVDRHRRLLALAIFLPLLYYLPAGYLRAWTGVGLEESLDRVLLQAPIALAVVSVALGHRFGPEPSGAARVPFPIHNLFLLGIRGTLAVFLAMGLFWLWQVGATLATWLARAGT